MRLRVLALFVFVVSVLGSASYAAVQLVTTSSANAGPEQRPWAAADRRDDAASAQLRAKELGERVEVTGLRDARSKTYANADGTMTSELGAGPVHVRRGGAWVDVDTNLVAEGAYVRPRAVPGDVRFSGGGRTALATSSSGAQSIGLHWPGELPEPALSADVARYVDVAAHTDIELQANRTGYDKRIVIKQRPAEAPVYRLPLQLRGLTARLTEDSSLEFVDGDGKVIGRAEPARMWGAAWDEQTGEYIKQAPVATRLLEQPGGSVVLELAPDPAFVADPEVQYPLSVDPSIHLPHTDDSWVRSTEPKTTHGDSAELPVGTNNSGGQVTRSLLRFAIDNKGPWTQRHVKSATFAMYQWHSYSCVQSETRIHAAGSYWNFRDVHWDIRPSAIPTIYASTTANCTADKWIRWNVTTLTDRWKTEALTNYGMYVVAANETDNNGWKKFYSWNYGQTAGNEGYIPSLAVTYESEPDVPQLVSPAHGSWSRSSSPGLTAKYTHPDGDAGVLRFWARNTGTGAEYASGDYSVSPGAQATWWASLPDGTYDWRAQASGGGYTSAWSAPWTVRIDATAPAVPSIGSSSHPDPLVCYTTASGSFSWSSSDANGVVYDYANSTSTSTEPNNRTTATSISGYGLPQGTSYWHVAAQDPAGNRSKSYRQVRVDTTAPGAPGSLSSSTHPSQSSWYSSRNPSVSWAAVTDVGCGTAGYSWHFSTDPNAVPDTIVDGTGTSTTASNLADGTWHFAVRTIDHVGYASGVSRFTIKIDGTRPATPSLSSSTHPNSSVWYANNNPAFAWSASDNVGVTGYDYTLDQSSTTVPTTPNSTATSLTWSGAPNGVDYFHVRARDAAGNTSDVARVLLRVDVSAPSGPANLRSTNSSTSRTWTIAWDASSDTPSGVKGYSWVFNKGSALTPDDTVESNDTFATSGTLDDLSTYYFTVKALDQAGNRSVVSTYKFDVDTRTVPGAPTGADATELDGAATVTWVAPTDTGGVPAADLSYSVEAWRSGATAAEKTTALCKSTATSCPPTVVAGLANGVDYFFKVYAHNVKGRSQPATSDTVRPLFTGDISKTVSPDGARQRGDLLDYTITIKNPNPADPLPIARVVDQVPVGLAVSAPSLTTTGCVETTCTANLTGQQITLEGKTIPAGGTLTIRYRVQVDVPEFSACTLLPNTAKTTDAFGADQAVAQVTGCGTGLGVESWWSMGSTALGAGATGSVNPANGNLVVEATDSAPMPARGRLGYLQARTYNSQEQTVATLPGSLGAGWRLDLGEAEDVAGGAVTGSALLVPRAGELIQTVSNPAAVRLVDRDGTRHLFQPRVLSAAIHTDASTLLAPNKILTERAVTAPGAVVCVDVAYTAPPGVDLGLWRYVKVSTTSGTTSTTPCASISDSNSVVLGYAAVRPDRLRTEYAATGELLSMVDGAGNELRYAYEGMPTGTLAGGVVTPGARLRLVYEARSCTPVDDGSGNPTLPAGCRATTFSYAADGLSTDVTDPAGRTTRYLFRSVTVAGLPGPVKVLSRVVNPPEVSGTVTSDHVDYSYEGDSDLTYGPTSCGGTALQLCSTTDARGSRTTFGYDNTGVLAGANVVPGRLTALTDRRGTTTSWTYHAGRTVAVRGAQQQTSYEGIDGYGRVGRILSGPAGDSTATSYPWLHQTVQAWDNDTGGGACEPASSTGRRANKLCQLQRLARPGTADKPGTPDEVTTFGYNDTGRTIKISRRLQTARGAAATTADTTYAFRKQYFDGTAAPSVVDEEATGSGAVTTATPPAAATALFALADLRQELGPRGNASSTPARYRTVLTVDADPAAQPSARLVAGVCDGTAANTGLLCARSTPYGAEADTTRALSTHSYDAFGQKTTMRTANGNAASPQHEPYRYVYYDADTKDLSGRTRAEGWLKAVVDPAGQYVAFGYDAAGNTARTWDRNATAATGSTPATFDPASAPRYAETLRGTGSTALSALSAPWRHVRSVRDPLGNTSRFEVDQHGNVTRSTPARGVIAGNSSFDTVTVFDKADAVEAVTTPTAGGTATTGYGYDAFGNRTSSSGPRAGQASRATFDAVNRQTSVETARGPVVTTGPAQKCRTVGAGGQAPFAAGAVVCTTSQSFDELDNVLSGTDAEGQTSTFEFDSLSRRLEQLVPRQRSDSSTTAAPNRTRTRYDLDGNVVIVCNPRQDSEGGGACDEKAIYATHTGYDVAGRAVTVSRYRDPSTLTSSNRLTTTTRFDANGNAVAVTDPRGNTTTSQFDKLDRLTTRTSPDGRATSYQHDPVGNTTAVLAPGEGTDNALGNSEDNKRFRITGYSFDANNRLVDTVVALQVDAPTNPTAVADAVRTAVPNEADQVNLRSRVHYDPDGHVDARFSPRAFVNRPVADPDPRFMLRVTHGTDGRPSGQYSPRADATGGPLDDPTGNNAQADQCAATAPTAGYPDAPPTYPTGLKVCASTMTYDAAGNPDVLTLPSAAAGPARQLRYSYTDANQLAQVTGPNPAGGTTDVVLVKYGRDAVGRTVTTLRDNDSGLTQTYTADGLVLTETGTASAAGVKHQTRHAYDAAGQRTRTYRMRGAGAEEVVQATSYYADGLIRSVTTGGTVRPAQTGTETAGDIVTSYTYDPNGNPIEVKSPAANHSLANPTAPDETNLGAPATSTYTKDNLLATSTQPIDVATGGVVTKARRTSYDYDRAGRKKTVQVDLTGLVPVTGSPQRFTYYPSDRLHEQHGRADATGGPFSISSSYDATGALTSTTDRRDSSATVTRTVKASYYLDGLLRHTDADARFSGYAYDGTGATTARGEGASLGSLTVTTYGRNTAGLATSMSTAGRTGTFGWAHNTRGELIEETLPNGHVQKWTVDAGDSTLANTTVRNATGDPLASYDYSYDELGRILSQTYSGQGADGSTVTGSKYAYSYDPAGRLSSFTDARGKRTLTFDHNSNRTAYGVSGEVDPIRFSYNADDSIKQSVAGSGGALGGEITRSYSYETFGGLASDGCASNSYDGLDRLTRTALASGAPADCGSKPTVDYRYDGLDRQVLRTPAGAAATSLVYDGLSSRLTRKTGTDAALYLLDADGVAKAADPDGQGIQYLSTDGTASTAVITDSTGKITCTARYDAYGNPNGNSSTAPGGSCNTGSTKNDVFYQGERKDTDTGSYQLGSRTYDPTKASFLTPDVYRTDDSSANVGLGTDPLTRNSYTYVNGDPVNFSDPSGHRPECGGGSSCREHQKLSDRRYAKQVIAASAKAADRRRAADAYSRVDTAVLATGAQASPGSRFAEYYQQRMWGIEWRIENGLAVAPHELQFYAEWFFASGRAVPSEGVQLLVEAAAPVGIVTKGATRLSAETAERLAGALASKADNASAVLPDALKTGDNARTGYLVYLGQADGVANVYVGITRQGAGRRLQQHGSRFSELMPIGHNLTKGQARAIEQAYMDRYPFTSNIANSISRRHAYYDQANEWGRAWLIERGY